MTRDSIIFYRSFYDSAKCLGDKARLILLDSILDVSFSEYKTVAELEQNCHKIGSKLERFRNVFAQFSLILPHILNSGKQYLNGKKGGAPVKNQNAKKQPKNKQIEIEKEIEKEYIYKHFKKPSLDEIEEYCSERNNGIDSEYFYDYYESRGWLIGKVKMKDWKAAVRNWEKNQQKYNRDTKKEQEEFDYENTPYRAF